MKCRVEILINRISLKLFDKDFKILVEHDKEYSNGRVYIQILYSAPCTKTKEIEEWRGRKWYLSKHMIDDEIVKTVYAAFEACVKHEVMEGFKIDNITLFNPHTSFEELLKISHKETKRI